MASLKIRDLAQVDVDLWGKAFETVPVTRRIEKQIAELETQLAQVPDSDPDKVVELTGQVLDLRLKPAGQGRKKAGELVVEKWNADQLTLSQLLQLVNDLGAADRPT